MVNLSFLYLGVYLVHWTHSFCVFIISEISRFFKMEYSIRKL